MIRSVFRARYDWVCGRHSGIPACCRVWFIAADLAPRRLRRVYWKLPATEAWDYIPCPRCLATGRGKDFALRECECDGLRNGPLK
jgi:hypothetical protein